MSKLKVGFIGAGGITHAHLPQLKERSDAVQLVGVTDINEEASKGLVEQYGIERIFANYQEMLPEVDAVVICLPTHLHADIAVACLEAGKAVFCEKPLARTLEDCQRIKDAAEKSGSPLQVGFVRRFDEDWGTFHKAVQAGKIGRPVVWHDVASGYGPLAPWFNQDEQGGGPFLDGCIHNIDFALSMFGPAKYAFATGRTNREGNTSIDTGSATIKFQSGDELLLAWSWGLPAGVAGGYVFEILGPNGVINRGAVEDPEAAFQNWTVVKGENDFEHIPHPTNALGDGFKLQMDEFIQVAKGEVKPRAGASEGLESVRVALAILESARTEQVVKL